MNTQQMYVWRRTLTYYGTLEQIHNFQVRRQLQGSMVTNVGSIFEYTNLLDVRPVVGGAILRDLLAEVQKQAHPSFSEQEAAAYQQALANIEFTLVNKGLLE